MVWPFLTMCALVRETQCQRNLPSFRGAQRELPLVFQSPVSGFMLRLYKIRTVKLEGTPFKGLLIPIGTMCREAI